MCGVGGDFSAYGLCTACSFICESSDVESTHKQKLQTTLVTPRTRTGTKKKKQGIGCLQPGSLSAGRTGTHKHSPNATAHSSTHAMPCAITDHERQPEGQPLEHAERLAQPRPRPHAVRDARLRHAGKNNKGGQGEERRGRKVRIQRRRQASDRELIRPSGAAAQPENTTHTHTGDTNKRVPAPCATAPPCTAVG